MAYIPTAWENEPSESTPINASNLNKMEEGIYNNSIDIETLSNNIKGVKLWKNNNPTSSFAPQNIVLNSSDYDEIVIYCLGDTTGTIMLSEKILRGYGTRMLFASEGSLKYWSRTFNYTNDTTIAVNNCIGMTTSGGNTENGFLIPLLVVGYKTDVNV